MAEQGFIERFNPSLTNDERRVLADKMKELQAGTDKRIREQQMPQDVAAFECAKELLGRTQ